jgi:transposase
MKRSYKIGHSREQVSLLPPCLEDYVGRDNPVRAIDAYVDSLDLNALDSCNVGSEGGAGQPPYDPADLLKLYLYGYLNQVRSSLRLEREARRNTEVIWLLRGLTPGYRTIANVRKSLPSGRAKAGPGEQRHRVAGGQSRVCAAGPQPGPAGRGAGGARRRVLSRRCQQSQHPDQEAAGGTAGGAGPQHRRIPVRADDQRPGGGKRRGGKRAARRRGHRGKTGRLASATPGGGDRFNKTRREWRRFGIADFRYDAAADLSRCPGDAELRPMRGQKRQASGKLAVRYASRRSVCRPARCARDAWPRAVSGARSSAGYTRTSSSGTGRACASRVKT